jgi:hypothetical protein
MTDTKTPLTEQPERLSLSATQILASGLAAVSATVAASYFGLAGTVIGAGLGSVISVVGGAIYSYSIRQTRSRVRRGLDVAVSQRFAVGGTNQPGTNQPGTSRGRRSDQLVANRLKPIWNSLNPRRLALVAAALFIATLAATTGFELASGQPLAATVHGQQGSGVSLDGGSTSRSSSTPVKPSPATSGNSAATSTSGSASPASPTVTVTVTPSSGQPTASPSDGPTSANPSNSATSAGPSSAPSSSPGG